MDSAHRRQQIMYYLACGGRKKISELADYFHVCERTIRRDLDYLSLHNNIRIANGRNGGVYLAKRCNPYHFYLSQAQVTLLNKLLSAANNQICELTNPEIDCLKDIMDKHA